MEKKICSKCKIEKDVCEFRKDNTKSDGLYSSCKLCKLKWRQENKELTNLSNKRSRDKNIEKRRLHNSLYQKNNREKVNLRMVNRRKNDTIFKLKCLIRSRVWNFLNYNNITKKNGTFDIVGCSPEFLKEYLEQKFTEGMSWDLMGQHIHIDHIIPLSSANTEEEIYKLCHYTNLQPLWAEDNLKKSNKTIIS
jgi:hypothetical protein